MQSAVCQYYRPFLLLEVILSGDVIIGYVFLDKERYVFNSFDECLCRKHRHSMKLNTTVKAS